MIDNELFLVDSLNEITYEHFKTACVACMAEEEELRGILGIPCGGEYTLYIGKGKALVKVRNWSSMLELHVVSESGTWLVCAHIDGMGVEGTIDMAWKMFEAVKPFIKTKAEKAFREVKMAENATGRWLESCAEYYKKIEELIKAGESK